VSGRLPEPARGVLPQVAGAVSGARARPANWVIASSFII
jgi:hypothetical protein